jgi:predicted molibdopterin-dependent oxidoreductase YjgC
MPPEPEGDRFMIDLNGRGVTAVAGQTVAAALLAAGIMAFRHTARSRPRGVFCGMGVCFDCLVTIDDIPDQRACMTLARPGMRISTSAAQAPSPEETRVLA